MRLLYNLRRRLLCACSAREEGSPRAALCAAPPRQATRGSDGLRGIHEDSAAASGNDPAGGAGGAGGWDAGEADNDEPEVKGVAEGGGGYLLQVGPIWHARLARPPGTPAWHARLARPLCACVAPVLRLYAGYTPPAVRPPYLHQPCVCFTPDLYQPAVTPAMLLAH